MAKKKIIIIGRGSGQNQDLPADVAELQQQIQKLTAERNALSLQLGVALGELEQANANVTGLTAEKEALQVAVDELTNQITDLDTQIETLNKRITELEETIKNLGGDVPSGEIIPGGPHNPENDAFEEDFLWIENIDDTDGTITLDLNQTPFIYYSYDDDTEFQKMVSSNVLSIPAHSKIYLRWKGRIITNVSSSGNANGLITNSTCNHNIGGELKNGGVKSSVYSYLFGRDNKLIDASQLKLSTTTLASSCYANMFYGCTSLTTAPELPATTLVSNCYANMFKGCTSLTTAPELSATTLAENCYQLMFYGCTSLTTAPELPATTLVSNCYYYMFGGCTSLNYVKTNVFSWSTSNAQNWLSGVAPTGTVCVLPGNTILENSTSGIPSGWTKQVNPTLKNTINIHNISGLENTISIPSRFSTFKYKTNNDTEYTENPQKTTLTITLQADETLTIEGVFFPDISTSTFTGITSTENINISGEVNFSMPYMFINLFSSNTKLIDAGQLKLSATTLDKYCYNSMFQGCTSLTTAPELPATTLASSCYANMFYGCTSLTTAPELPATTLEYYCYDSMFQGCTSLTTAPELPATTLASFCYVNMFRDCTALTTAPELPATTLVSNCYQLMFRGCTSLTTAPELPATTLAQYCYTNMFRGCTSLTTAPELPATTLVSNCYAGMFYGCKKLNSLTFLSTEPFIYNDYNSRDSWLIGVSSTGTFRTPIENKEWIENYPRDTSAVPSGWTIEYI